MVHPQAPDILNIKLTCLRNSENFTISFGPPKIKSGGKKLGTQMSNGEIVMEREREVKWGVYEQFAILSYQYSILWGPYKKSGIINIRIYTECGSLDRLSRTLISHYWSFPPGRLTLPTPPHTYTEFWVTYVQRSKLPVSLKKPLSRWESSKLGSCQLAGTRAADQLGWSKGMEHLLQNTPPSSQFPQATHGTLSVTFVTFAWHCVTFAQHYGQNLLTK